MTHFPACPPACALGLGVASGGIGRLVRRSPQRVLARCVSSLRTSPANSTGRGRFLLAAFRSPAAIALSESLRGGINVPGLPIQNPPGPERHPFGLWAPLPLQGMPSLEGQDHRPRPVVTPANQQSRNLPGLPLPFWAFTHPAHCARPGSVSRSLLLREARFPFAPRSRRF